MNISIDERGFIRPNIKIFKLVNGIYDFELHIKFVP